jgi:hypothetical protein
MPVPDNLAAPPPRLLDLQQAAQYLSVLPWTVRDLEASGVIPRVCIPLRNGRKLRKLLFDRADLDRLIETWKCPTAAENQQRENHRSLTSTTSARYPEIPVRAGQR